MKIIFLGTAAATSMPLAFCNCNVCKQAKINRGKDFRARSSVVINNEMLVDLGPDVVLQANRYHIDLGKIKYLVQTHSHADHFDAGHFITRWSQYASKDLTHLNILCSKETCDDINNCIKMQEPAFEIYNKILQKDLNYNLQFLKSGDIVKIDNYTITAVDSFHDDRVKALIYIISYKDKNILYGTDLCKIDEISWDIIKKYKYNVVILDQTYGKGYNNGGHLDSGQVIDIINKMKTLNLIFANTFIYATHISHEGNGNHENIEKDAIFNGYHIAYDGLELNL